MELPEPQTLTIGDMELDVERGRLSKGRLSRQLGPMKFRIMTIFGQYPNRTLSEERLRLALYGEEYRTESALRSNITGCRRIIRSLRSKAQIKGTPHYGWEFIP